jgi:hypothetical protein
MPSFEEELAAGFAELASSAGRGFSCRGVSFNATLSEADALRGEFDVAGKHFGTTIEVLRSSFTPALFPRIGDTITEETSRARYRIDDIPDADVSDPTLKIRVTRLAKAA